MGQKKAPPEKRKTQIIEAAMQCFQHKGYENTTIDDIAAAYGLSKGSIYCYYPSKRDILIAVFNHLISKLFNAYESFVLSNATAKQKLLQMGRAIAETLLRDHKVYRPIMVLWSVALEDEFLREMSAELYKKGDQLIKEILKQGQDEGEFAVGNINAMSALLIAIGEGFFTRQILMNDLPVDDIEKEMEPIIERLFPPITKGNDDMPQPQTRKEVIINTLTCGPNGLWKKTGTEYLQWQAENVTVKVSLSDDEEKE